MCSTSRSFSPQMNSMSSASVRSSTISFWFTRTVKGAVYAFGSSMVTSIFMVP